MSDSKRHFVGCLVLAGALTLAALGRGAEQPGSAAPGRVEPQEAVDPVFVVKISEELLTDLLRRPIREDSRVNTTILGTPVEGNAFTYGRLYLDCVESDDKARFWLLFAGQTWAETVGHHDPAHIHTSSTTRFITGKEFTYAINDRLEFEPARIIADSQRQTRGIASSLPGLRGMIVRNAASRRLAGMRGALDAEAHREAETRVKESFERQMQERLGTFRKRMSMLSKQVDTMNPDRKYAWNIGTSDRHLLIVASELPTDGSPPPASLAGLRLPQAQRNAAVEIWQHPRWREGQVQALQQSFATFRRTLELLTDAGLIPERFGEQVDQLIRLETIVAAQDEWRIVHVLDEPEQ